MTQRPAPAPAAVPCPLRPLGQAVSLVCRLHGLAPRDGGYGVTGRRWSSVAGGPRDSGRDGRMAEGRGGEARRGEGNGRSVQGRLGKGPGGNGHKASPVAAKTNLALTGLLPRPLTPATSHGSSLSQPVDLRQLPAAQRTQRNNNNTHAHAEEEQDTDGRQWEGQGDAPSSPSSLVRSGRVPRQWPGPDKRTVSLKWHASLCRHRWPAPTDARVACSRRVFAAKLMLPRRTRGRGIALAVRQDSGMPRSENEKGGTF
jgi:hypothetical protein